MIAPGTRLGPYVTSVPIGAGGMGEVYKATDLKAEGGWLGRLARPRLRATCAACLPVIEEHNRRMKPPVTN
jgi:hypothetical protein